MTRLGKLNSVKPSTERVAPANGVPAGSTPGPASAIRSPGSDP